MKTIAYTALAYGSPYLAWAIRSIIDHVDEYYVLYSADGSHSHKSTMPLPDCENRDNLHKLATLAAGAKLRWVDGDWTQEGQQRDSIHAIAPDADVVLVLDYDEIWPEAVVKKVKLFAESVTYTEPHRFIRLPIVHFWRSFRRCVTGDPAFPVRVIFPGIVSGESTWNAIYARGSIAHLGYAIPDYLMAYKRGIHGHKAEFRTDIDWHTERWQANAQADCHPVGSEFWNPETVNPMDYMPEFMRYHPYFSKDVIE